MRFKQIGFEELDSISNVVARGIAPCNRQGRCGNIGRNNSCARKFFCQSDGDAAGAGADVGDLEAFTGENLFAPCANLPDG